MAGIFHSYFWDYKWKILGWMIFFISMAIFQAYIGIVFNGIAFMVVMGSAFVFEKPCFSIYWRVMPVKPGTVVLAQYIITAISIVFGAVMAFAIVLVFGRNDFTVYLNSFLFLTGMVITTNSVCPNYKMRYIMFLPSAITVVVQLYIVFGVSAIHSVVFDVIDGIQIRDSTVFTDTTRWLVFLVISIVAYIISYFVSLAIYKRSEI